MSVSFSHPRASMCLFAETSAGGMIRSSAHFARRYFPNTAKSYLGSAAGERDTRVLYDGHIPISPLQRVGVTLLSAVGAVINPERGDLVAALGDATGHFALKRLKKTMSLYPEGREILQERPLMRSSDVDIEYLRSLQPGTFGEAYTKFMDAHSFSMDERSPVRFVDDPDLAYVLTRYRQVHDLWHVLADLPPTVDAEVALKWFEMTQTGLPVATLSALGGSVRVPSDKKKTLRRVYIPWAVRAGRKARPLLTVWYERRWEMSLDDVRAELSFEAAPKL